MTKVILPRLVAVCAVIAPAVRAAPNGPRLTLFGPRENLPWHQHDALWELTGKEWTSKKPKPWTQEAYVIPQRPGKNQVRYFDFHWRDHDFLEDDGSAGIRFYFYDREYPVARIAAGLVRQSWAYLTDRFNYKPSFKVPYILYNTYREFLETNVFEVQEGVLGVTSPQDLRMVLSYSGDRQLFTEVSTHEMVHQFHIQKVAERAASAGLDSPIGAFPLWFTEGLAEYYAHGQTIDPETDMFLRDVVLNPNGEIGYDIPSLEEDRPYAFLYTYKYGQAKLVFLAETYGEKVIQAVLDQSPRLAGGGRRGEPPGGGAGGSGFMGLLARIAGEQPQQMNARWQEWMRKRAYPTYLASKQDLPDVTELKLPDELDWFVSSRDGNLIFYRGVERDTGRAKLILIDRRDPSSHKQIAIDQHPGTESLHPVMKSVMAVCDTGIAWFAQDGESDVLHYRPLNRVVRGVDTRAAPAPVQSTPAGQRPPGRGRGPSTFTGIDAVGQRAPVDLRLGADREIRIVNDGVIEAGDPGFSPDCQRLAFYGLDRDGKSDIYTFDLKGDSHVRRLTEDLYAERDISWGDEGIVYAGDATESGRFNLFRINPDTGTRERLTDAPVNQRHPVALAGGAVLFDSEAGGKNDLWFLQDGRIKRLTDFTTALSHPGLAPNGIYGVAWYGARFRMMEVPTSEMLSVDEQDAIPPSYASTINSPLPFPDEPIPQNAPEYIALDLGKNWRIEGGGAAIGGVGIGLAPVGGGGVVFADVLRDRSFLANLAVYGSFDLTDALAFYVDRSKRLVWGAGLFNTFQQGRDISFAGSENCGQIPTQPNQAAPACEVFYLQRMFGAQGLLSYPFSTFSRIDAGLRVQGMSRSILENGIFDANGFRTTLPVGAANSITGFDSEIESSLSYGWDTTRYGPGGAIGGSSVLLTLGGGTLPRRGVDGFFAYTQTDAIHTIRLFSRTKITARAALGYAQGNRFGRHFFLSSFDNLRGFRFNDTRLLGDAYYVAQTELAFPLDFLIRFAFFSGITGIVGLDFGGVVETNRAARLHPGKSRLAAAVTEAWDNRTMDYVLGVNFGLGPFELRVQFAHGIDIGGLVPERDDNGNPTWVPNISLHYAYF